VIGIDAAAAVDGALEFEAFLGAGDPTPRETLGGPLGANLQYTSGTTGKPKGAVRMPPADPTALRAVLTLLMDRFGMAPGERHLLACPMCHAAPPAYVQMAHLVGGTVVIMRRFDAEQALAAIDAERITSTFMVPTMLNRIGSLPDAVRERYDHSTLRTIITGGSLASAALKARVAETLGQVLFDLYGSTETGLNTMLEPADQISHGDTVGRLLPGGDVQFRDEDGNVVADGEAGQIWARNPLQFSGYHNDPEGTDAALKDGWVTAGDVGYIDDEGYVHILDRVKDMVISGGVNIYPAEIEATLAKHPDVFDAAIIGVPDPDWGESLLAFVQPQPGASISPPDLEAFCRAELADFKCPRKWEIIDEIPRNHAGKVLKKDLRAPYWADRSARV
jgi:long-chain acyl-CoA synthetase